MKLDRGEVGVWLSECADYDAVAVDSPKLAALCRLALEVMGAPVATIDRYLGNELEGATGEEFYGQRVRLVRVGDGDACIGGGEG